MNKSTFLLLPLCFALFFSIIPLWSQHCGTDEVVHQLLEQHPELKAQMDSREQYIQNFVARLDDFKSENDTPLYIIPVVFHVIHSGGRENVPKSYLLNAIKELNDNFNRRNADTIDTPDAFKPIAANTRIEFRLATIDPDGNCTDGIVRVYTPTLPRKEDEVVALSRWPLNQYMNVWILRENVGPFGFKWSGLAYFPSINDNNGIYLINRWFNEDNSVCFIHFWHGGSGFANWDALTHEAGHWLNLYHIWGPTNDPNPANGCQQSDQVNDTPPQEKANYTTCPSFPSITCNNGPNGDNFSNFMDYSTCKNMFSTGQRNRMWAALNSALGGRNNLSKPANLAATGAANPYEYTACPQKPLADFGYGRYYNFYCLSDSIPFFDASWKGDAKEWHWTFEGGHPATSTLQHPKVFFDSSGIYEVTLVASNEHGSDTLTRSVHVVLLPDEIVYTANSLLEDFEDTSRVKKIFIYDDFSDLSWHLVTDGGYNSSQSFRLRSPNAPIDMIPIDNSEDGFVTPFFDISNLENGSLSFYVAYHNEGPEIAFSVLALPDCDVNHAIPIANLPADSVHNPNFIGGTNDPEDWRKITLPLPSEVFEHNQIRFFIRLFHDQEWTQTFIDNIAIEALPVSTKETPEFGSWKIFPNPASNYLQVQAPEGIDSPNARLRLTDLSGNVMITRWLNASFSEVSLQSLPTGTYFLTLQTNEQVMARRLVVMR